MHISTNALLTLLRSPQYLAEHKMLYGHASAVRALPCSSNMSARPFSDRARHAAESWGGHEATPGLPCPALPP